MKKIVAFGLFSFFLSVCIAQNSDQVLMTIADKNVTKSEFEYIWNKNNSNSSAEKVSLDNYVNLFVNFKIKVAQAESLGLDTTKTFKDELSSYRSQLSAPYLVDDQAREEMKLQAYMRLKEFVEVSHIMVNCDANATPEDSLQAYKKIVAIYAQLAKGGDFEKIAKENSDDASKDQGGYLGYTIGRRMIWPFENVAYSTNIGAFSHPFRTPFGYHIVKVKNRVPAWGKYRSAHIMKVFPPNATALQQAAIKDSIQQIYKALEQGAKFSELAAIHSNDRNSSQDGGEYGVLMCGTLPFEYELNVHNLEVGKYSKPFQTKDGWHIVKALEFLPFPSYEEMTPELSSYVASNTYISDYLKARKADSFRVYYEYKLDSIVYNKLCKAFESIRLKNDSVGLKNLVALNPTLFSLRNNPYSVSQFIDVLKSNPGSSNTMMQSIDGYSRDLATELEDKLLEIKYPEFGHLMQEYRDGILLFEVSNKEVWEKSSTDEAGLNAFFEKNKEKYNWSKPHYKGVLISCTTSEVAKKAKKALRNVPLDSVSVQLRKAFNTDTTSMIMVERGLFVQGDNARVDHLVFGKPAPEVDKLYPVSFVQGKLLKTSPEDYQDVRGLLVADYQNELENAWLQQLRKKFKVVVNKEVLNRVNKN